MLQTLADQLFIARFEDMQRQSHAGEEHHLEREEGKKFAHYPILNERHSRELHHGMG